MPRFQFARVGHTLLPYQMHTDVEVALLSLKNQWEISDENGKTQQFVFQNLCFLFLILTCSE
jgi:hypothetical protein